MIVVTILLCALSIPPSDCTPDTATDVITMPATDISCVQPMQLLASLAIEAGERHYWKIECGR